MNDARRPNASRPNDRSTFWKRLIDSGLAGAGDAPPDDSPAAEEELSVKDLATAMVREGRLTRWQAKQLLGGESESLRFGSCVRLGTQGPTPFRHWQTVSTARNVRSDAPPNWESTSSQPSSFLLSRKLTSSKATVPTDTTASDTNAPRETLDTAAFAQILSIHHANLQSYWLDTNELDTRSSLSSTGNDVAPTQAFCVTRLPPGQLLSQATTDPSQPWSSEDVIQFCQSVLGGLDRLHQAGLIHGEVRPDRIWLDSSRSAVLLWDPTIHTDRINAPFAQSTPSWFEQSENAFHFIAPEISAGHPATPSSDYYSLGCTAFLLRYGKPPFRGDKTECIKKHQSSFPKRLVHAVRSPERADPLDRLLAYLLAKNIDSRFTNAESLQGALEVLAQPTKQANSKQPAQNIAPTIPASAPPAASKPTVGTHQDDPGKETDESEPSLATSSDTTPVHLDSTAPMEATPIPPEPTVLVAPEPNLASSLSAQSHPVEPIETTTPDPVRRRRRRRRRRSPIPVVLGMVSIPLLCVAIAWALQASPRSSSVSTVVQRRTLPDGEVPSVFGSSFPDEKPTPAENIEDSNRKPASIEWVDDRTALWARPTSLATLGGTDVGSPLDAPSSAQPIPLSLLPPGPGMILHLQLKDRLFADSGKRLLSAMAPESTQLLRRLRDRLQVEMNDLDSVTIAFFPNSDASATTGSPKLCITATLVEPITRSDLAKRLGVSAARTREGQTIYAGDEVGADAVYFDENPRSRAVPVASDESLNAEEPSEGSQSSGNDPKKDPLVFRFAVGDLDHIQDIASVDGEPILLPRSMERLWQQTDDRLAVTLLWTPNFLFADARLYLQTILPRAESELRQFLVTRVVSALLIADTSTNSTYVETQWVPAGGIRDKELVEQLRQQVNRLPGSAETFLRQTNVDVSWRALALRLPQMFRFFVQQVRYSTEERRSIANAYLPPGALAQVALGSMLASNTQPDTIQGTLAGDPSIQTSEKASLDDLLNLPLSITFGQESLAAAAQLIAEEFNDEQDASKQIQPILVLGNDLRLMGITQNQQIVDFRWLDTPLRKVLTQLVLGANPDKSVSGPSDPKQALVWAIDPKAAQIVITTRDAAVERYQLPDEFKTTE